MVGLCTIRSTLEYSGLQDASAQSTEHWQATQRSQALPGKVLLVVSYAYESYWSRSTAGLEMSFHPNSEQKSHETGGNISKLTYAVLSGTLNPKSNKTCIC